MTNNGDIVNRIMRAGNMHEKEYIVTVNKLVTDSFSRGLGRGVPLVKLNATTRKMQSMEDREKAVWHYTDTGIETVRSAHV